VSPCPHCGAVAHFEPSAALRWRCGVCGGPVVPTEDGAHRSHGELGDLVAAQRLRAIAVGWRAAAIVLGGVALMAIGVALLLLGLSHTAFAVLVVLGLGAAALSAVTAGRAGRRSLEARERIDLAWQKAAGDVLRDGHAEVTATQLAATMHTDEAHAESILAHLSALGQARVDVRDDDDLGYRIAEDAPVEDVDPAKQEQRGR
jgi:hypothetical protein